VYRSSGECALSEFSNAGVHTYLTWMELVPGVVPALVALSERLEADVPLGNGEEPLGQLQRLHIRGVSQTVNRSICG
jgi:hypothetical protein